MSIIFVHYPNYERGGVKLNFINFLKVIKKINKTFYIITNGRFESKSFNTNIKLINISKKKIPFINVKLSQSIGSIWKLIKLFHKHRKEKINVISFQSSFFISIICFFFKKKFIIRISEDPFMATKFADNIIFAYFVFLTKYITYNLSDTILVNSRTMKNNVMKMIFNKNKIMLIYNKNIKKIKKINHEIKKNYFLSVGRLCKQKNQQVLIKAYFLFLKTYNNFQLHIVGDGPDSIKLKNLCKKLNILKNVKFFGWKKNVDKYYENSKIYVLPSLYEGLPNSLINSLNHELVAISSNVSGVNDIYGNNCVIFNGRTPHDLCSAMIYSVKNYNKYLIKVKKQKKNIKNFLISKLKKEVIKILK